MAKPPAIKARTLKEHLEIEKLTPAEFSRQSGVAVSIITRLVNGQRGTSLPNAIKIRDASSGKVPVDACDLSRTPAEADAAEVQESS